MALVYLFGDLRGPGFDVARPSANSVSPVTIKQYATFAGNRLEQQNVVDGACLQTLSHLAGRRCVEFATDIFIHVIARAEAVSKQSLYRHLEQPHELYSLSLSPYFSSSLGKKPPTNVPHS